MNHNNVNPFKFRPGHMQDKDWEDNWLSNSIAFFSLLLMPYMCKDENSWAVKFSNYFWAECSCCLLFRGILIGVSVTVITQLALNAIF